MSSTWSGGSTRAWRKLRAWVIFDRDGGVCRLQIPTVCTYVATHAHHTRGRRVTGDDPRFIVAACQPCNLHIGDPTTHDPRCPLCAATARPRRPRRVSSWDDVPACDVSRETCDTGDGGADQ